MKYWLKGVAVGLVVFLWLLPKIGFAAEVKKVLFLHTVRSVPMAQKAAASLEEQGFIDQQTIMIDWVEVSAENDSAQLVAQVKGAAPDVVVSFTALDNVVSVLEQFAVPVIAVTAIEPFVNTDGTPIANVTGVYSNLQDIMFNSYKFLQTVAPLQAGQQAVFLDNHEMPLVVPKEDVVDALKRLQIPLKTVVDGTIFEDWQEAILQYSADPEVGWILHGAGPSSKRDGSSVNTNAEAYPWLQTHLKKPSISHRSSAVQAGAALCGFGFSLADVGGQCGEMAARILQGEPLSAITAEYPQKVTIVLNRKKATELGIVFSVDVLKVASEIYDDYEGKQVIRK